MGTPRFVAKNRAWQLLRSGPQQDVREGFVALKSIDLEIRRGEIFALLGPNGAGKTTLINIICGIVNPTSGTVDRRRSRHRARLPRARARAIGLVPQELSTDMFETVWATVQLQPRPVRQADEPGAHREGAARRCRCGTSATTKIMTLSGGMKRRVLIAKALSHEPQILFLDEPTAGVDVELRRDMWKMVRGLRESGVTIILTTHYIEEAEQMADRIGVINKGELILVEDKDVLMRKLGKKQLTLSLQRPLDARFRRRSSALRARAVDGRHARLHVRRASASRPASPRCSQRSREPASSSRTCTPARARSRTSSSAWCRRPA